MDFDWIVGWFFTFFSLMGNTWVIFLIAKRRRLQTTANWFILSLAVADLGVTCGYFPASMICNVLVDTCNDDVRLRFADFFIDASHICLTTLVAERYIAIVHPLKYVRLLTSTRTIFIIATCWAIPFFSLVFRFIVYLFGSQDFAAETAKFGVIFTVLFEVLPTILLFSAHFHILLIALKLSREMKTLLKQVKFNVATNSVDIMTVRNVGLKSPTVRLVTVLVITFVAYYGLEIHASICFGFNFCDVSKHELVAANLLLLANSTLNPLVYAFLKEGIKRESKAFFCRRRRLQGHPF